MKRFISVFLAAVVILTSLSFSAFAANEFKSGQLKVTVPENLIEDVQWAKDNGYAYYWHTEDYGFEFALWTDPVWGLLNLGPVDSEYICHGFDKNLEYEIDRSGAKNVDVNGYNFVQDISTIKNGDKTVEYHWYVLDEFKHEAGDDYSFMTFYVHNKDYEHYIDEILKSVSVERTPEIFTPKNVVTFLLLFAIALIILNNRNKKRRNKQ